MSLARKYRIVPTSSPWISEDGEYAILNYAEDRYIKNNL